MTPLDASVLDALPVQTIIEVVNEAGVFRLVKVHPSHWVDLLDGITLHTLDVLDGEPHRVVVLPGEDPGDVPDSE